MTRKHEIPRQKHYALGWYHEGVTHLSMHEYEEALSYFDRALKAVPDHPDFLIGKGEVLMAFGEHQDAYECFLAAATAEPENLKGCILLGTALLKLRKYEPADEAFLAAITLNRYDGEAWLGHAIASYHLGEEAGAKEALLTSYHLKPEQPELMYYLARTASSDQEAISYLARGCRLDPKNLNLITAIAERLMNIGRFEEAAIFCRRACELCPEHPEVRAAAGRCKEAQKKSELTSQKSNA
ncbi:tetratricopeptide repeat protein [Methanofollis aquaemaris]|uniref:Tetratricopeptide repeat protein n=1 Tax=Methanofollis aquaemaris TaxID=126734 RepID=A0A8A3S530_9EURY|nr:tetratricopeptide repeat protein [Methanofollis aquaemaris]QSZ66841.1 tetratricopeptide repeat protein [Methanofollis aquaemaris]